MNQPDFMLENAPALAEIIRHREEITSEAFAASFTSSVTSVIRAEDFLAQRALGGAELEPVIDAVLAAHPEQVETFRGGKEGVLGFLVGQVMRETQGKADPKVVNRLLQEKLRG